MLVLLIYIKFGNTKLDNVKLAVRHFIIFKFVKINRKVVHKLPPAPSGGCSVRWCYISYQTGSRKTTFDAN
jgi:hypothetical protein